MAPLIIIYTVMYQQFNHNINEYVTINVKEKPISAEQYNNMVSEKSINLFESLGGMEKVTRKGGRVVERVSTSPSGELRTIRTFKFSE